MPVQGKLCQTAFEQHDLSPAEDIGQKVCAELHAVRNYRVLPIETEFRALLIETTRSTVNCSVRQAVWLY